VSSTTKEPYPFDTECWLSACMFVVSLERSESMQLTKRAQHVHSSHFIGTNEARRLNIKPTLPELASISTSRLQEGRTLIASTIRGLKLLVYAVLSY
jgi:hypothetical protein